MKPRPVILTILAIVLVAAFVGRLFWQEPQAHRRRFRPLPVGPRVAPPSPFTFSPSGGPGPLPGSAPEARLTANVACRAGAYTLSVHSIRSLLMPPNSFGMPYFGPMGPFALRLEVLGDTGGDLLVDIDPHTLRAVDSSGRTLTCQPGTEVRIPVTGGMIFQENMEAPDPSARALKSIDGTLRVETSSGHEAIPFHLPGMPLPNGPRIFGRFAPRELPATIARTLPPGLSVVAGPKAARLLDTSAAVPLPRSMLPEYLVLGDGQPAQVSVPDPGAGDRVSLQAVSGPAGTIDLQLGYGRERWSGEVWDGDAFLVVLPAGKESSRMALIVRLGRGGNPPLEVQDPQSPFLPSDGSAGGAIGSAVMVGDRPFGRGLLQVELQLRQGSAWSQPRTLNVSVHEDGSFILPNLAPGEYRMVRRVAALEPVTPFQTVIPIPLSDYLKSRFHTAGGKWTGEEVAPITVRSGQQTDVPPLKWTPARSAASGRRTGVQLVWLDKPAGRQGFS